MKIALQPSGFVRPAFQGDASDRQTSSSQDELNRCLSLSVEWSRYQKQAFSKALKSSTTSSLSRDKEAMDLVEDIQQLEIGLIDSKKLASRDAVSTIFARPGGKLATSLDDEYKFTSEHQRELRDRQDTNCIKMGGFAKYTEERAKYKSTMRVDKPKDNKKPKRH